MDRISIADLLMLLASAQGAFLGVFILHRYRNLLANRFLATMMFLHSALLLQMSFQGLVGLDANSTLVMTLIGTAFAAGPLHYLYAKYLSQPGAKVSRREFIHFIPFLFYEVLVLVFYNPNGPIAHLGAEINSEAEWLSRFGLFHLAVVIQYGAYLIHTQQILQRYSRRVEEVFSTLDKIKLNWLQHITWLALVIVSVYGFEYFLLVFRNGSGGYFAISSIMLVVYVYIMGYLGLFKSEVLMSAPLREAFQVSAEMEPASGSVPQSSHNSPSPKYTKSGLSEEDLKQYKSILLAKMASQSPQADSGLTLDQLAGMTGLSPHNLSEVINKGLGQNFFEFVNGYRVQEVQKSLLDPKKAHLTILALSLEAGFASKSTFNSIFKKYTDLTPSAWRKQNSSLS